MMVRRRMKPAFLLLLVASVLLLSAASKHLRPNQHKNDTAPKPQNVQRQQPEVPLSVWQATDAALREAITSIKERAIAEQEQAYAYKETWCSPAVLIQIVLSVIGAGYLIFAGLQWKAINKQARIANDTLAETRKAADATERYVALTKEMSETAKQSAHAAELALNAERPYLFVESQQLRVSEFRPISFSQPLLTAALGNEPKTEAREMQVKVGFEIRNRGKGVAVFDRVSTRMILIEEPLSLRRPYRFIKAGLAQQFVRARIIGAGEGASCDSTGLRLSKDQWDRVKDIRLGIIVRITVFYEDVFKRKFWSKFTFEFNPPTPATESLGVILPAINGFLMSSPIARQTRFK